MFVIKHKKIFLIISLIFMLGSLGLLIGKGLPLGIDFTGGSQTVVTYEERPTGDRVREVLASSIFSGAIVQLSGDTSISIKTRDLSPEEQSDFFALLAETGEITETSFISIGPSLGQELKKKAITALILVLLGIIFFVAYAFRKVSKPVSSWKYGLIAIIALFHDVLITTGVFIVFAGLTGVTADALFIVALLTVLGLSVNDTIVVFDRVRENLKEKVAENFSDVVGISLQQTFLRSINTSLSTILVLLGLFFFGPATTKVFALTLAFGMFIGTYSSIFLASPLLVLWQKKDKDEPVE